MPSDFASHFDYGVRHLYLLHGLDCTYTRSTESWTVRLIPHIQDGLFGVTWRGTVSPLACVFRSLVSVPASITALYGKTADTTFITPTLQDVITYNGNTYKIAPCDEMKRGWRYLNDRRKQIEIHTLMCERAEDH